MKRLLIALSALMLLASCAANSLTVKVRPTNTQLKKGVTFGDSEITKNSDDEYVKKFKVMGPETVEVNVSDIYNNRPRGRTSFTFDNKDSKEEKETLLFPIKLRVTTEPKDTLVDFVKVNGKFAVKDGKTKEYVFTIEDYKDEEKIYSAVIEAQFSDELTPVKKTVPIDTVTNDTATALIRARSRYILIDAMPNGTPLESVKVNGELLKLDKSPDINAYFFRLHKYDDNAETVDIDVEVKYPGDDFPVKRKATINLKLDKVIRIFPPPVARQVQAVGQHKFKRRLRKENEIFLVEVPSVYGNHPGRCFHPSLYP